MQSQSIVQEDSLHAENRKAITFSLVGLSLAGGIGGKYWVTDAYAAKLEVRGSYDLSTVDRADTTLPNQKHIAVFLSALGTFELHFGNSKNLSPFVALYGGITWRKNEDDYYYRTSTIVSNPSMVGLTGGMAFGIEYWLSRNISVGGQQAVEAFYNVSKGSSTTSDFEIQNTTSSLLLSFYF